MATPAADDEYPLLRSLAPLSSQAFGEAVVESVRNAALFSSVAARREQAALELDVEVVDIAYGPEHIVLKASWRLTDRVSGTVGA